MVRDTCLLSRPGWGEDVDRLINGLEGETFQTVGGFLGFGVDTTPWRR